ncbi:hypothetical protein PGT21_028008 [Puccinia graminis f. sp. tritici]|uniref:Uncharacterized protein n=1 Tax=Puccinia graminis f. sp. tritici TaxID=56615 RepID=A0A5B0LR35_PUCGR|nr:hypothetical protein PGT21_028008 [Puccinia graminis f. sp. tritici]KAA1128378.1 hypothetical protein PGTUg99_017201 [Puccinia graminis f. sp. tritici]
MNFNSLNHHQQQQQQQQQTNNNWIHQARHRHHHSLDSTTTTTTTTHQHLINLQPNQLTPTSPTDHINKFTKRSLSLSATQSASNKLSPPSPTNTHHPSITIQPTNLYTQHTQKTSKPKSKPSLVSAIPAAILKKDKPGLLSQEQKRANHIASEQKRRAAIRQGYSRLCLIVPALRAPIGAGGMVAGTSTFAETGEGQGSHEQSVVSRRSEEDSPAEDDPHPAEDSSNSGTFKRKRNSKPLEVSRSGARSEAVVLAKTVEYLRELELERRQFLEKLKRLKSIARAQGIPLMDNRLKKNQADHSTATEEEKENRYQGEEKLEDPELPIWECKWTGNIHEIDRQFNAQFSPINDQQQPPPLNLGLIIEPNCNLASAASPPIPFDLHSFHHHQLPSQLPQQNQNLNHQQQQQQDPLHFDHLNPNQLIES